MRGEASKSSARAALRVRLTRLLSPLDARLRYRALDAVLERLLAEVGLVAPSDTQLALALVRASDAFLGALARVEGKLEALLVAYRGATTEAERREVSVDYLRQSSSDPVRLARDIAATKRWLDLEALQDRISAEIADRTDEVEVVCSLVQSLARRSESLATLTVHRLLSPVLDQARQSHGDVIRGAALRAATALLQRLPVGERLLCVDTGSLRAISNWAEETSLDVWTRIAAMEFCAAAHPAHLAGRVLRWIEQREGASSMLVRRNALRVLGEANLSAGVKRKLAWRAHTDPSEHVRQELCRLLAMLDDSRSVHRLAELCLTDAASCVRAFGLRELASRAATHDTARPVLAKVLKQTLLTSQDAACLRMALSALAELSAGPLVVLSGAAFVEELETLVRRPGVPPRVVQEAALLLWRLEAVEHSALVGTGHALQRALQGLGEGKSHRVRLSEALTRGELEKAVRVAAGDDFAVAIEPLGRGRYTLARGEPRGFRVWRALHEARNPAPDKRKGYSHTSGRARVGSIVVPPQRLAEVTPTRVPGERRYQDAVGGWGPFLPRVDDLLSVCGWRRSSVRLVTALGTVELSSPRSLRERLQVRALLTARYAAFDELRERSLGAKEAGARQAYAGRLSKLGFRIQLVDTEGTIGGRRFSVLCQLAVRYLPAAPVVVLPVWFDDALWHLLNTSGNMPWHLALVAWAIFAVVMVRAAWILQSIEGARRSIPLSIGGWGTRGKSGTERLKSALFHDLRYDVVVKTTGCEAMFIHARRDRPAQEIFLYRPYDKATIWEQRDVLQAAHRFGTQVFLWECMALQPQFVELLAREWMKDEITTLTNAYPDHEDVMGPSGEDVARVIARFMPSRGTTFTAEEQMLPIIGEGARAKKTHLVTVDTLEADLLPRDLLDRFPYAEHPLNIALVLSLAEHLGIDRERALVAMADKVIPDLGVLKTYPAVTHVGRRLEFTNGMSANERAGFLSNWRRLGFDTHDADGEPGTVLVTVVNNRGDRVPRSRVFADILVRDISVDYIVLIGTNLGGMRRFIEETLDRWLEGLSLSESAVAGEALERFDESMRRLKVPLRAGALKETLCRMLEALGVTDDCASEMLAQGPLRDALEQRPEGVEEELRRLLGALPNLDAELRGEVCAHGGFLAQRHARVRVARAAVAAAIEAGRGDEANQVLRAVYRELFLERVATVERADTSGDGVIDFIARRVPPGHRARLMGCQNIKGTGLDFVYRWLSIDAVHTALGRLRSDAGSRAETLSWLLARPDFGLLDCREALAELRTIREAAAPEWAEHRALLEAAIERLERVEQERLTRMTVSARTALWEQALGRIEPLFDHLDSIRRRRLATRIMDDLFEGRLGQGRAALLMRDLVAREKGGWLAKDVKKWLERRAASRPVSDKEPEEQEGPPLADPS